MELIACPFCGGKPTVIRLGNNRVSAVVECEDCGCRLESNEEGAGRHWNQRKDDAKAVEQLTSENAALKQSLKAKSEEADGYGAQVNGQANLLMNIADTCRSRGVAAGSDPMGPYKPLDVRVIEVIHHLERERDEARKCLACRVDHTTRLLNTLADYKKELIDTARIRENAGDESAQLAFLASAERLVEMVGAWITPENPEEATCAKG